MNCPACWSGCAGPAWLWQVQPQGPGICGGSWRGSLRDCCAAATEQGYRRSGRTRWATWLQTRSGICKRASWSWSPRTVAVGRMKRRPSWQIRRRRGFLPGERRKSADRGDAKDERMLLTGDAVVLNRLPLHRACNRPVPPGTAFSPRTFAQGVRISQERARGSPTARHLLSQVAGVLADFASLPARLATAMVNGVRGAAIRRFAPTGAGNADRAIGHKMIKAVCLQRGLNKCLVLKTISPGTLHLGNPQTWVNT